VADSSIDLLATERGTVTAPAGCGKTHLIAEALTRHSGPKPILILTHTNSGVAALRTRLDKLGVAPRQFRVSTLDGWALRLLGTFPRRSGIEPSLLAVANPRRDYPAVRDAAWRLMKAGHVQDVIRSTYARLIVDEYQDCSLPQHALVYHAAPALPIAVLGDPMQAIFGWQGNELADWERHVCTHFPLAGELTTPWRWRNAGTEEFGFWLLHVRRKLLGGEPIDLDTAPRQVRWVHLDGTEDRVRQLRAARIKTTDRDGSVLIIGKSTSPPSQQEFASQIPGAVTVEAVDLRDLVQFARELDFGDAGAMAKVVEFAGSVMTNVGSIDLIQRVGVLERGTERRKASDAERAALRFKAQPTPRAAVDLLVEISKGAGVRAHRPAVLRASIKALQSCNGSGGSTLYDAAIRAREQNRILGRPLPRRAVGSTLLLKGLEAEVSVILDAADLDRRNLYVAMTRGSKQLIVCSGSATLGA
jgi:AAA domain